MVNQKHYKALYAAFDLFPTSKGASTHISHMARYLFDFYGNGLLYTLGNETYPDFESEGNTDIIRFSKRIPHYLNRAFEYSHHLEQTLRDHHEIKHIHFRDIWSGLGIFNSDTTAKTLFEVNGLPSIELPYRYPNLTRATLAKIEKLEDLCLSRSSHIIAPSGVIQSMLMSRGVSQYKIDIIPNAADANPKFEDQDNLPENYILYFGALQSWQGIDTLLKAFAGLKDMTDLKLVICSSNRQKVSQPYMKLALKLGIADNIIWQHQLDKPVLNTWIKNALLSIAPLRECSRNIRQGCSPLKIYESMACGTAVIASDLPVSREILDDNLSGKLVPPDRPQELSRAIRILIEYPKLRQKLADNGLNYIQTVANWDQIKNKLETVYSTKL
ncbi:MAG: glycosyltransferase [Carboxylicivirga sp.]|jgi:glycosyltransferase involved in cell wall biosynthesis|nr:glycosyltransferase [Carboxylicivirga sp.]